MSIDGWFQRNRLWGEMESLESMGLVRVLRQVEPISATVGLLEDGRQVMLFCTNDYLGLRFHHQVIQAGVNALRKWGAGAGASRLISGNHGLYRALEERLAILKGAEDCLIFSSGYAANVGLVSALAGRGDRVWADHLAHASLLDGAIMSRARLGRFQHNDVADLERRMGSRGPGVGSCGVKARVSTVSVPDIGPDYLAQSRTPFSLSEGDQSGAEIVNLVLTEGVFSMDGDIAPLQELHACSLANQALLVVDDAHGTGVLGPAGAGTIAHIACSSSRDEAPATAQSPGKALKLVSAKSSPSASSLQKSVNLLQTGTLSKALASVGGFVAGSREVIAWLANKGRSLMFSTALPPSALASAMAALDVVESEPWRQEAVADKAQYIRNRLREMGYVVPAGETPIIPVIMGNVASATRLADHLLERGVLAPAIRPPTVEPGKARIRLSVCAEHNDAQIDAMLEAFAAAPSDVRP